MSSSLSGAEGNAMNILLIGSGGREHALSWKLAQSPLLGKLYAAPGNPGVAEHAQLVALELTDHASVVTFCETHHIGLIVVGPEAPLVDGLSDSLRAAGFSVFGPSQAAAQLEGSARALPRICARAPGSPPQAMSARVAGRGARCFGALWRSGGDQG
jgi:phosphoribosylamine--glycine ligase